MLILLMIRGRTRGWPCLSVFGDAQGVGHQADTSGGSTKFERSGGQILTKL